MARVDSADGRNQFFAGHALEQIGLRAGLQCAVNVFVAVISGQYDEARMRIFSAQALYDFHSTQSGQAQVNQRNRRPVLSELSYRLYTIGGLTHYFQTLDHFEQ